MFTNKKGAALLQVLLVTVVLAGMATMLLRASLSRTTTSRQTRRTVSGQMLIDACQAEVNTMWSLKPEVYFTRDLKHCVMGCKNIKGVCVYEDGTLGPAGSREYKCKPVTVQDVTYQVTATFTGTEPDAQTGQCEIKYEITDDPDEIEAYSTQYSAKATENNDDDDNGGNNGGGYHPIRPIIDPVTPVINEEELEEGTAHERALTPSQLLF